jgi:hypothetical protein
MEAGLQEPRIYLQIAVGPKGSRGTAQRPPSARYPPVSTREDGSDQPRVDAGSLSSLEVGDYRPPAPVNTLPDVVVAFVGPVLWCRLQATSVMARYPRWQQRAATEIIVNDKRASRALLRVPLIIFRQHGCPTPTR